jgi:O-antigen/teichoic acid export membrane protein
MVAVTAVASRDNSQIEAQAERPSSRRLDSTIAVCDQAVVSGVNFLTAQMLIAWGSREIGGAYALAWVLVLFTRSTIINLVAAPYTVRAGKGESKFAVYAGNSLLQQLSISLVASIVLAIVGAYFLWISQSHEPFLGYTFLAAAIVLPALMAREYARQISFAHSAPWAALTMDVVSGVLQIGALFAFLQYAVSSPLAYLISGGAAVFGFAAWTSFGVQKVAISRSTCRQDWTDNWQFGRWALVSQITGNLAPLPWIIFLMWGAGETGAFDGANRIVGLSNILVIGYCNFLAAAASNAFASEGAPGLRRVVSRAATIFAAGLGGLCLLSLIWGGDLLELVMRGKVLNSGGIVAVLAFATLLDGLSQIALHSLRAMNRPSDTLLPDLAEVAVTLACGIPLTWLYSAPGAAWAMVFGRFIGLLLRWSVYVRRTRKQLTSPPLTGASL